MSLVSSEVLDLIPASQFSAETRRRREETGSGTLRPRLPPRSVRVSGTTHLEHMPFPFFPGSSAGQAEDAEADPLQNSASLRLGGISKWCHLLFRSRSDV